MTPWTIAINPEHVGIILGKKWNNLYRLQNKFNTKIYYSNVKSVYHGYPYFTVYGIYENIFRCILEIQRLAGISMQNKMNTYYQEKIISESHKKLNNKNWVCTCDHKRWGNYKCLNCRKKKLSEWCTCFNNGYCISVCDKCKSCSIMKTVRFNISD